jgi:hypothetical protein
MEVIKIEDFAETLAAQMAEYTAEVADEVNKQIDNLAKEVNETIKQHVTFEQPTGDYVKSFRLRLKPGNTRFNHTVIWHVKAPHYRLTHLLENGHALRNGGRSKAFPHIKYGEELVQNRIEEIVREAVEKVNGK